MIAPDWRRELHAYIAGTARGLDATCMAVGGVEDHIHVLCRMKATHRLSDFMRDLKTASSKWAAERYLAFAWQDGYAALSVSASAVESVRRYIENQDEHHKKVSSAEELRALLEEYGVEYDERFFD
jgi:putative transposase